MFVTYRPEDGESQEWVFDPKRVKASQGEMIEKRFGGNFDQWLAALQQGNMKARRVLLWHLMSLSHPTLRYEDTPDFYAGELEVQYNVAELRELRDQVARNKQLDSEERDLILGRIDAELEEAAERERRHGAVSEGKAPSKSGENATPSR